MNKFGQTSLIRLSTCHPDLQIVLKLAITRSDIDFGIAYGIRTTSVQQSLFAAGKSKCDGKIIKSKHQYKPSKAVDIYLYHPDKEMRQKMNNDFSSLSYVAGVIMCCVKAVNENQFVRGIKPLNIRWGGNWNMNGIIILDQKFLDLYHFEIV